MNRTVTTERARLFTARSSTRRTIERRPAGINIVTTCQEILALIPAHTAGEPVGDRIAALALDLAAVCDGLSMPEAAAQYRRMAADYARPRHDHAAPIAA